MGTSRPDAGPAPTRRGSAASAGAHDWRSRALDALPAAATASVAAVAISLGLGLLFGVPILAQEAGDRVVVLIPLPVFELLLHFFGSQAKHLFFAGLVLVQAVLSTGALLAYWVARNRLLGHRDGTRAGIGDAAVVLALWWLGASLVFAPLLGSAGAAPSFVAAWQLALVATSVPGLVTSGVFVWLIREQAQTRARQTEAEARMSRRAALRAAGLVLGAAAVGAAAWGVLSSLAAQVGLNSAGGGAPLRLGEQPTRIVPPPTPNYGSWAPVSGQTAEVTPADQFYYVSKNIESDPSVASAQWHLSVTGLVDRPLTLSYADLQAMPAIEQYQTLECISNEVGGNLMSNGRWTGVSLAHLLSLAGVRAGATGVVFRCADGYSDVLHLAQAMGPRALVAYLLDGAPLAQAHGFPARLLVPGLFGMKNGKWVTELDVTSAPYEGYWEHQGWTSEAVVKMTSRIDVPSDGQLLHAGPHAIAGVAFSGDQGISRVDVSTDAGQTWQTATLKVPLAQQTWVLWELGWAATPGTHVIAVRAVDAQGYVQTPSVAPPLPDGASGYDAVTVTVQ